MQFQPHFLHIATLLIGSILLILSSAAIRPVCANSKGESEAERYVLQRLQKGEQADFELDTFPENKRELRASFIEALLTNRDSRLKIHPHGVSIAGAVIKGQLDLIRQEIPFDVLLLGCIFEDYVDLTDSHFAKNLNLTRSKFNESVNLNGTTVDLEFVAAGANFFKGASFGEMRVLRGFIIIGSTFDSGVRGESVSFEGVRVGGDFEAGVSTFISSQVSFDDMRVDGTFEAEDCVFKGGRLSFVGAHFHDVFLNGSTFDRVHSVDFSRVQADFISFDEVKCVTLMGVKLQRMTFKLLSPINAEQIEFLLANYDAEFYTDLEASWRTHGYPDEADKVFIAKRRAERRGNCENFWRKCNRMVWASSMFQDMLAGYGKSLKNLLYWSLGFLLIGTLVFGSEKGMRTKDAMNAEHYKGRYQAFWYSLDLFLPIIKLGEADVWTPKDNRRWAILYKKLHIIIGSLFVPIGLAAWTGIIK